MSKGCFQTVIDAQDCFVSKATARLKQDDMFQRTTSQASPTTHRMSSLWYRESYTRRSHNHSAIFLRKKDRLNVRRLVFDEEDSVWGIHRHSNRHTPQGSASCVQSFDDSLIVQFALRIAFRCVLHRCRNLDIRC